MASLFVFFLVVVEIGVGVLLLFLPKSFLLFPVSITVGFFGFHVRLHLPRPSPSRCHSSSRLSKTSNTRPATPSLSVSSLSVISEPPDPPPPNAASYAYARTRRTCVRGHDLRCAVHECQRRVRLLMVRLSRILVFCVLFHPPSPGRCSSRGRLLSFSPPSSSFCVSMIGGCWSRLVVMVIPPSLVS